MARGRMITNRICTDKDINDLSDDTCRLLFTWLVTFSDAEGRTYGDPAIVRSMVFPRRTDISTEQVEGYIRELHAVGLILWYTAAGDRYIWFPNFEKHQPGLRKDREPESELPGPSPDEIDDYIRMFSGNYPDDCRMFAGSDPDDIRKNAGLREGEEKLRELEKEVEGESGAPAAPAAFVSSCEDIEAERIFQNVTGMISFPSVGRDEAIARIRAVHNRRTQAETEAYLRPYYAAWIERKYRKVNMNWLDWAITGEIPPPKQGPRNSRDRPAAAPALKTELDVAREYLRMNPNGSQAAKYRAMLAQENGHDDPNPGRTT
jgi:hypothetical protein